MSIKNDPVHKVRIFTLLTLIGWTFFVLSMIWINWDWMQDHILEIAQAEARASIEKDILYRNWNAGHGGVYVPVTDTTQPNPYLDAPEREITTPSGRLLTLVNPAYMTRQVYENQKASGTLAHLTSLKPINPNNKPDAWEIQALRSFEDGATETSSVELINGEKYMRLMRPFITTEDCLKCHAQQGYSVGDVRGGLSVSVPMSNFSGLTRNSTQIILIGYGSIWLVGLASIFLASRRLHKYFLERDGFLATAEKSREEYRTLLETSLDGFWQSDLFGNLLEVNDAYCQMSGYSREELLNMNASMLDINEDADEVKSHIERVIAHTADRFEAIHRRKDGRLFQVEVSVQYLKTGKLFVFLRDMTAQKQAELALRESDRRLSETLRNVQLITVSLDQNGNITFCNDYLLKLTNWSRDELIGKNWFDTCLPQDENSAEVKKIFNGFIASGDIPTTYDNEIITREGQRRIVRWSNTVIRDLEGQVTGTSSIGEDITKQRLAEEKLRDSEARLKASQQVAHVGHWTWDTQTNNVSWSDEMYRIFGLNPETFDGNLTSIIANAIHPDDQEKVNASNQIVLTEQKSAPLEYRVIWPDKSVHTVWAVPSERITDINGNILKLSGIVQDITERKRVEESLHENETLLMQAQQVASLGYYLLDIQTGVWRSSDILDGIFGIAADYPKNVQGWAEIVHPDEREEMTSYFANEVVGKRKNFDHEYRIMRVNDQVVRWVHGLGELQFDVQGNPLRMIGTIQDITERKYSEEALRLSEERFRTLVTSSDDIIFTLDTAERHTGVFGKWVKKSNLKPEYFIRRTTIEIMGIEAGKVHHEANLRALRGENVVYEWQSTADNKTTYYQTSISPMYDACGKVMGIVGIGHNITNLKNVENELRAREAHLKQAQYLAKLGMWEWDPVTDITTWSDEMLKIYGITREQFSGNGSDYINFTHPDDRPIQQANIHKDFEKAGQSALETGQTIDDAPDPKEFRIIRPDGSICWVQGDAIEYVDEKGNPLRMLGVLQDITSRKLSEQVLRESEERYRLLFDEMMDGFALHEVICDKDGHPIDYRFVAVNSAFEDMTGLKASEITGKTVLEVLPTTEPYWIERYGKVALTGEPDHFEDFSTALNSYYEVRAFSPEPNKFAVIFHDISQRKHSENITMARMKFVEIATTHSLDTLIQTILDESETLTGSCIGFYHFLEADQKTLTLQNWSTRTVAEFCRANGKGTHYPVDQAGVWVECIQEKKPVIHNDYASLSAARRKGMPEGHAEVIRELVVPVMRGDRVVAILGVGNKQTDYTHKDVDIVQQLGDLAMEIVERKRAEDAQMKTQQNYETLIQTIEGIVWEADAQTFQFSFVSAQAERLLGYPVNRWLEEPNFWANHIHPDDRDQAVNFCVSQTKAMAAHEFEYRMLASDERVVWLRDVVSVIVENNKPTKLRGIMIDITEKKASEEKIHQLSLAVEQNPASVVITDLNGSIEYVNPKFTQITGYPAEKVIGSNPRILRSGNTSFAIYEDLWNTITSGKTWHGELQNRKKNGELFWEDVMISPLTNSAGKITHYVAVKEDITERKRAEGEIAEKNTDLAALFSISAHLRTATSADEMLPLVLREMGKVLTADANAVILLDPNQTSFTYALGDGLLAQNTGQRFSAENSISGIIMKTRQPYISTDYANDPNRAMKLVDYENIGSAALVPLQSESEFIGVLLSARHKDSPKGEFSQAEIQLLTSIGEMVGTALRRAKLYDQALQRLQRVQALRSIDASINANMDSSITLRALLGQAIKILNVDAATIVLYNSNTHMIKYGAVLGFQHKSFEDTYLTLEDGSIAKEVISEHRMVNIPDLAQTDSSTYGEMAKKEGFVSCYISPMIAKGQICGMLEVYSRSPLNPNEEWMDFLESLSAQAAIAIDNARLFIDLQKSNLELTLAYDATITGWSHALDLKDKETEGHTQRVTTWTVELARRAGLSENQIIHIRRGALLHDIGKMATPDNILNKTGSLSPEEWAIMREHPQTAYNMLYPIEFLRPALDIPYCHHEKWDGSGYPRGLKGLQIPFAARLFAVIDVWDALTSNRSYRSAWTNKKAIAHIKSENGKHFDPDVVEKFIQMLEEMEKDS